MTEAAPKTCGICRWWEKDGIPSPLVGTCEIKRCTQEIDAIACPAHSSADDAKRREEFVKAVGALVGMLRKMYDGGMDGKTAKEIGVHESMFLPALAAVERLLP